MHGNNSAMKTRAQLRARYDKIGLDKHRLEPRLAALPICCAALGLVRPPVV